MAASEGERAGMERGGGTRVRLEEPQRAVRLGRACVFCEGDRVLGGWMNVQTDELVKGERAWIVLVTAPDMEPARAIARAVLSARLAACVNLVPALESHYWWQGQLESSTEVLLVIKTTAARLTALAAEVRRHHPYDTPEVVTWPIAAGSRRYLEWLEAAVADKPA